MLVAEKRYPKGSPSPDPSTYMTDEELVAKFRHNADGVLAPDAIGELVQAVMNLESVSDFGRVMRLTGQLPRTQRLVAVG